MSAPRTIRTELGTERRCPRCGDYWPADDPEFWQPMVRRGRPGFHSWCRACIAESKAAERQHRAVFALA